MRKESSEAPNLKRIRLMVHDHWRRAGGCEKILTAKFEDPLEWYQKLMERRVAACKKRYAQQDKDLWNGVEFGFDMCGSCRENTQFATYDSTTYRCRQDEYPVNQFEDSKVADLFFFKVKTRF